MIYNSNDIFVNKVIDFNIGDILEEYYKLSSLRRYQLPTSLAPIDKIYPHQELLSVNKIKDIIENGALKINDFEDIFLIYKDNKYYVIDGHHRIAAQILIGKKDIEAKIYSLN